MGMKVYINFAGNGQEAVAFYEQVFAPSRVQVMRYKDVPAQPGQPKMPDEIKEQIMHAELDIFDSTLMISDATGEYLDTYEFGNNMSILLDTNDKDKIDLAFAKLKEGAKQVVELGPTFFSAYYGMLVDQFGIMWQFYLEKE